MTRNADGVQGSLALAFGGRVWLVARQQNVSIASAAVVVARDAVGPTSASTTYLSDVRCSVMARLRLSAQVEPGTSFPDVLVRLAEQYKAQRDTR